MDLANHLLVVRSQDVDGHLVKEGMGSGGGRRVSRLPPSSACIGVERSGASLLCAPA